MGEEAVEVGRDVRLDAAALLLARLLLARLRCLARCGELRPLLCHFRPQSPSYPNEAGEHLNGDVARRVAQRAARVRRELNEPLREDLHVRQLVEVASAAGNERAPKIRVLCRALLVFRVFRRQEDLLHVQVQESALHNRRLNKLCDVDLDVFKRLGVGDVVGDERLVVRQRTHAAHEVRPPLLLRRRQRPRVRVRHALCRNVIVIVRLLALLCFDRGVDHEQQQLENRLQPPLPICRAKIVNKTFNDRLRRAALRKRIDDCAIPCDLVVLIRALALAQQRHRRRRVAAR